MKTRTKELFVVPALIGGIGLMLAGRLTAQSFTILHSFTATDPNTGTNIDGAYSVRRFDFIGQHPVRNGEQTEKGNTNRNTHGSEG